MFGRLFVTGLAGFLAWVSVLVAPQVAGAGVVEAVGAVGFIGWVWLWLLPTTVAVWRGREG